MKIVAVALTLALAVTAVPLTAPVASAAAIADQDARNRINLAGRQRMLTQRMSKAACMIHMGIDVERHKVVLSDAAILFSETHSALQKGGGAHVLSPETDGDILAKLAEVDALWADLKIAVEEFQSTQSETSLQSIARLNVPTLVKMHEAVGLIQASYSDGVIDPLLAKTINVAGRQRMLTQRASKEACFIAAGVDAVESHNSLKNTVSLFDSSLVDLMEGNPDEGIVPPVIDDLAWQLETVQDTWSELKRKHQRCC